MKKQDWTPRQHDWTPQETIMNLSGHEWWDYMQGTFKTLGEVAFYQWVLRMARPWYRRAKFINQMAWNDRNSTFYLDYAAIIRTHHFSTDDREKVTADIVAQSMVAMLA